MLTHCTVYNLTSLQQDRSILPGKTPSVCDVFSVGPPFLFKLIIQINRRQSIFRAFSLFHFLLSRLAKLAQWTNMWLIRFLFARATGCLFLYNMIPIFVLLPLFTGDTSFALFICDFYYSVSHEVPALSLRSLIHWMVYLSLSLIALCIIFKLFPPNISNHL